MTDRSALEFDALAWPCRFAAMILHRVYDEGLAQATWIVGCERTGEAVVFDPPRDLTSIRQVLQARSLRVIVVAETHIHADFISGARELARSTGATLLLSAEGGDEWSYRYAESDGARLARDGDSCEVGDVLIEVMHMPGHTPEHLIFRITDRASASTAVGLVTGDFLFVGDVGRPDLLERAAGVVGNAEHAARALFHSLGRLASLPGHLQIWPGHGAGSACGKQLGSLPSSTLGYERIANWALAVNDEQRFVEEVLAEQPEAPAYFARMKRINRDGPTPMPRLSPAEVGFETLAAAIDSPDGVRVIDARPTADFGRGFIAGAINIPAGTSFETWAGWLLGEHDRLILIVPGATPDEAHAQATRLAERLAVIGLERVEGFASSPMLAEWRKRGRALALLPRVGAEELARSLGSSLSLPKAQIVDVRGDAEWNAGHLPGATHRFLGTLEESIGDLDRSSPVVVHCQGGTRASVAGSLLVAHGFTNVINFAGGVDEWTRAGLPVERDDASSTISASR